MPSIATRGALSAKGFGFGMGGVSLPAIGSAYGGGFFAGQINVSGTIYNLVVAPKASGESSQAWGPYGATTGFTSDINGPINSAGEAALGSAYAAATFCNNLNSGGGLNGYTDWYLPAKNELEVLYYFLKPTTDANNTSSGANTNAVLPEPYNTNYSSGSPAQTSAGIGFRTGETDAFISNNYWSSTEVSSGTALRQSFSSGRQTNGGMDGIIYVRAARRIPV
jgi:hypothetical protein